MDAEVKNANEYGYFAKETLTELEITSSTLRRWSIALEDQGYKFTRNEESTNLLRTRLQSHQSLEKASFEWRTLYGRHRCSRSNGLAQSRWSERP